MTMLEEAPTALSTPASPEVIETLEQASKLIAAGWCQGVGHRIDHQEVEGRIVATDQYCMVGAIAQGWRGSPEGYSDASDLVERLVRDQFGTSVVNFNDDPGRTQAEVLDVFQTALDRARGF